MSRVAYFLSGPLKGQLMALPGPFHYVYAPTMELYPTVYSEGDVVPDEQPLRKISDVIYHPVGKHNDVYIYDLVPGGVDNG